ncbi:cyclin-like protein [Endogone sp. FLAS-F59071]|nr:cyclin-like protein [Endogone sp. FLAS-F59071]|eukprot:RUS15737.1 cyclin-like protein [Endogone sp. FLAS-F59071]
MFKTTDFLQRLAEKNTLVVKTGPILHSKGKENLPSPGKLSEDFYADIFGEECQKRVKADTDTQQSFLRLLTDIPEMVGGHTLSRPDSLDTEQSSVTLGMHANSVNDDHSGSHELEPPIANTISSPMSALSGTFNVWNDAADLRCEDKLFSDEDENEIDLPTDLTLSPSMDILYCDEEIDSISLDIENIDPWRPSSPTISPPCSPVPSLWVTPPNRIVPSRFELRRRNSNASVIESSETDDWDGDEQPVVNQSNSVHDGVTRETDVWEDEDQRVMSQSDSIRRSTTLAIEEEDQLVGSQSDPIANDDELERVQTRTVQSTTNENGCEEATTKVRSPFSVIFDQTLLQSTPTQPNKSARRRPVVSPEVAKERLASMEEVSIHRAIMKRKNLTEEERSILDLAHDVWREMIKSEKKYMPWEYLDQHVQFNEAMRAILVDWIFETCEVHGFKRETLHLAVNFLDRYFSVAEDCLRQDLQLIGATCLWIATKVEEYDPPTSTEIVDGSDRIFTVLQLKGKELQVCKALGWELRPPTLFQWVTTYLQNFLVLAHATDNIDSSQSLSDCLQRWFDVVTLSEMMDMLDAAIYDYRYLRFSPSILGAGCLSLFCDVDDTALQRCTGYQWDDIAECVEWLADYKRIVQNSDFCSTAKQASEFGHNDPQTHEYQYYNSCVLKAVTDKFESECINIKDTADLE